MTGLLVGPRTPVLVSLSLCLFNQHKDTQALGTSPCFVHCPAISTSSSRSRRRCALGRGGGGRWKLRSSPGSSDEENADDASNSFPDTLGQDAPYGVSSEKWDRLLRSARDRQAEDDRLSPSPNHSPAHVAVVTLQAMRRNDVPYPNFGCEVAIRFSSSSNPASGFTPGGLRTYMDDPSMPFYRVLSEWDEMGPVGDAERNDDDHDVGDDVARLRTEKATQQVRVRKEGDAAWSTVSMDFVREEGCWLIERLWVDDKRAPDGGNGGGDDEGDPSSPPTRLTVAELFDEDRLEMMGCRLADYDPASLAAGGGNWLEDRPHPSLSPKAVALTCIISLRQNDEGRRHQPSPAGDAGGAPEKSLSGNDAGAAGTADAVADDGRPMNEGCERVIRFCSPTNVASTLSPAHFAQYLNEPWYAILKEWDELSFHSEDISEDGTSADLVVLLRRKDEEAWTSVNWELVMCDGMWLTERIWVVDV